MLFNGGGMIDPNAQAFNYAQVDIDNAFLIRTKMPYETNAGGQIFSAAFAGSNDWRPRSLLEKYYTPKNPVEVLYKDLGIIPKF